MSGVSPAAPMAARPGSAGPGANESLALIADARAVVPNRIDGVDLEAMQLVLLLYRVTNAIVYDIESTVHRPAGWSWSAFRLCFTLWVDGPLEVRTAAQRTGMSKPAVTALANTLQKQGLLARTDLAGDGRGRVLSLTPAGASHLETVFREHNAREARWAQTLTAEELRTITGVLSRLADVGQQDWVSTR